MEETKKLLSNSSIIFVGTIIGSFFSYLFNMLVGRMLGPVKYGEFSSIMSLIMILSVGGGALTMVCMKYTSDLYATGNFGALKRLIKFFSKYVLILGIVLFGIALIFLGPISRFLSIKNSLPIGIALFNFVIGFLVVINRGFLQGTQRFMVISYTSALETLLRLLIGIFLIKLGFEVAGAMTGVVLATTTVYFVTFLPIISFFRKNKAEKNVPYRFDKKEIVHYAIPSLIAATLLAIAFNIDIILVKHYFDPEIAGNYAAISTIAKIIFFATGPVVSVMFPMISEKTAKGDKHYRLFLTSLALTLTGALIILGAYYIAPGTIIKILYGQKYVSFYSLLPQIGFAVLLYSLINLLVNYFMVIRDYFFVMIFSFVILIQIILISQFHSSLEIFAKILIATFSLLFVLLFGYYLIKKKDQLASYFRGTYGDES